MAYDNGRVPLADFIMLVFCGILKREIAGLMNWFCVSLRSDVNPLSNSDEMVNAGRTSVVILVNSGIGRG